MLDEDQSFSISANITSPGWQSVALSGYIVSHRGNETWIAPLIPQLFYGASGAQLSSWRQYLPTAGSQVILSRSGGRPSVPREELFWRRVSAPAPTPIPTPIPTPTAEVPQIPWMPIAAILGIALVGVILWKT